MDALITAGGTPQPGEPLYEYTLGKPKSLLDVAGKPMIQWVLDALGDSQMVESVVVVGIDETSGVTCIKPLTFIPDQKGMFENLQAGAFKVAELKPGTKVVLSISSDIPAITGKMVDWAVQKVQETDNELYYLVHSREVMETRFPESHRSYYRLGNVDVCGADVHAFDISLVTTRQDLWRSLVAARKNAFHQAAILGFDTLILFALRLATVDQLAQRVGRHLKIRTRVEFCPYAEAGMDADKPFQVEILRRNLEKTITTDNHIQK
jgi:GTP:adenosylcobinamide-phosphate guanylyltransferase